MISLVVPVYNEEEAIPLFYREARAKLAALDMPVELLFIDDGSTDTSLTLIEALAAADPLVRYLSFSRNFGKEAALSAGLDHCRGEAAIPMDVDLQHPVDLIPEMIAKWRQGAEIVLAKRLSRQGDSFCRRNAARLFYRLHKRIAEAPMEEDTGDFRLMDRKVVEALKRLPERRLFMKGAFSWVGFTRDMVAYTRPPRVAGRSKYCGRQLWNLALEGLTSFSTWPLRVWTYAGVATALLAFAYAAFVILDAVLRGNPLPGYSSLMAAILFLGGVQLIGIGVLGEYLGRIYHETKQRPRFIIRKSNVENVP
jgi:glycosyltransferase involved in cell wall biosynthesis